MNASRGAIARTRRRTKRRGVSYVEAMVLIAFAIGVVLAGAKLLGRQADETSESLGEHIKSMTETHSRTSSLGSGASSGSTYSPQSAGCDSTHGCEGAPSASDAPAAAAATQPLAAPAAATPAARSKGLGDYALSVGKGVVIDGVWGTLTGLGSMVLHPVDTAKGVYQAASHPVDTYTAAKDSLAKAWAEDPARVIGGGLFQVVTIVGPGAITKLGTAAKLGEVASDASAANKIAEASKLAKVSETSGAGELTTSATAKLADDSAAACKGAACGVPGGNCFAAGTPVLTAEGERPIEQVHVGDWVFARIPETGEMKLERVVRELVTPEREVVDLGIEAGGVVDHLKVTGEHPFFAQGRGFVPVKDLAIGEHVQTAVGEATVVSFMSIPESTTVFNFEVEEAHTYFVGETAAWVHNQCAKPPVYEASPKHGTQKVGNIGAAPTNGQAALESSVPIKGTTTRRVGVDAATNELVVFDETHPGQAIFHGHVRDWSELSTQQQNALTKAGLTDRRGRILSKP